MREMKDSGVEWIGEIPKDWDYFRIKYNFYLKGRIGWQGLKAEEFIDVGPYLITGTDFQNGRVNWETCYHISDERYIEAPEIHVTNDDLLITKDGTVGKVAYIEAVPDKASLNSHILLIRSKVDLIANKYLFWVLQSPMFDIYNGLAQNGTIMASLSQEKISNFSFVIPELHQQHRIADYLDAKCAQIDRAIVRQQEVIEKLKEYKLSVITEVVTKGLNPEAPMKDSGIEWIGKIPEHWGLPSIKRIARLTSGGTPDRGHPEYWNGEIPWIKTGELKNDFIFDAEEYITEMGLQSSSARVFDANTILMAMYGQGKTRGMTGLLKISAATNQACCGITVNNDIVTVDYLWIFLIGSYEAIRAEAAGSGQPNLNAELIYGFHVTVPPLEEQADIYNFLINIGTKIDSAIKKKEQLIDKLTEYKKSLIYEVVTGKREV